MGHALYLQKVELDSNDNPRSAGSRPWTLKTHPAIIFDISTPSHHAGRSIGRDRIIAFGPSTAIRCSCGSVFCLIDATEAAMLGPALDNNDLLPSLTALVIALTVSDLE